MRTLISNAEIIAALRSHFGIPAELPITFTHMEDGVNAVAGGTVGYANQFKTAGASIGASTGESPAADVATTSESTPKTRQRKATSVAKPKEDGNDADDGDTDPVIEALDNHEAEKAKPNGTGFGRKKAAAVPVEPEPAEDEAVEDGEGESEEVEETPEPETKPKRTFGRKTTTPVAEPEPADEEEEEDQQADEDEAEPEPAPVTTGFAKRKSVFGKRA